MEQKQARKDYVKMMKKYNISEKLD